MCFRSVESSGQPASHAHGRGGGVSRGGRARPAQQTGERVLRQLRDEEGVCLKMCRANFHRTGNDLGLFILSTGSSDR